MRSDEKEIPSSSGSFLAGAMDYTSSNKTERKEHKGILATCGIWKGVPQQNGKFIGPGSLIKDFFPNCDKKTHLVTSDKVISPDALRFYSLYFKKSKDKEEEPKKLVDMVSDEVIFKSGLAIVPVDPNKLNFKRKRHPPSTICAKVRKDLRNDELYCHVLESFGGPFTITLYQVKGMQTKKHISLTTFRERWKALDFTKIIGKALELQLQLQSMRRQLLWVPLLLTTITKFLLFCFLRLIGHG